MEKRQRFKSHISKVKTNDDMEIIDPKTILEQGKMFYKNLYTEAHCNDSNYKLFFENWLSKFVTPAAERRMKEANLYL